jgi:NAD(P)-dependent dehydrogenase (short-subunit alcohol dehydrogenase family)
LTRSLGTRLSRHGIRVNAIGPGLFNTAMGARAAGCKGWCQDKRIEPQWRVRGNASVVDFPASDAGSFVTGATIDVSAGL